MASILSCRGICAGFEDKTVLHGVKFDVPATGLLALVGPAGVGKSTLLRTLARYNEQLPSFWMEGSIRFNDRDLVADFSIEEAHSRVALLAQKARLFTANVQDNAIAHLRPDTPLSLPEQRRIARSVLERLNLGELLGSRLSDSVTSLSIAEQRMLGIARLIGGEIEVLLVDEPFRDIDEAEIPALQRTLMLAKQICPVVMVTHNQQRARALADEVLLLVGGRTVEQTTAAGFFSAPRTSLGEQYLRTGSCWPSDEAEFQRFESPVSVSAPSSVELESRAVVVSEECPSVLPIEPTIHHSKPRFLTPGGFHWILRERLGGMQRPGLLREEQDDLAALRFLGVKYLVTLTESPYPSERLKPYGIVGSHFPIPDMGVPELEAARELCNSINRRIEAGYPTIVHCKAGLGRTGTILACVLVARGTGGLRAIDEVRQINSMYIQSDVQLEFVQRFELER